MIEGHKEGQEVEEPEDLGLKGAGVLTPKHSIWVFWGQCGPEVVAEGVRIACT